ncbi:AAA ATPase, CDC48 sub [Turnera subulata]|uniref:AAA ATPase, CDC48 sub n=1 Tax=Turnera subulata TaxID=218843 RepID=A0A9Q0FF17_9ROSI|nr:AAA ATPase, CDC48 sub [Turnera subulata]
MDSQISSILWVCSLLLFCLLVATRVLKRNQSPKLPPGPRTLPLIGNLHQIGGKMLHHNLAELAKKHGPLMHLQLGEVSTIVVSSPETATEILKTQDLVFAHRPSLTAVNVVGYGSSGIAFAPYGNYWRQMRKLCVIEVLSASRVQQFGPIREEEVSNLVAAIASNVGSPVNLSDNILSLTHAITSRAALGDTCKDQKQFMSIMLQVLKLTQGFCLADMYPSVPGLQLITGLKFKLEKLRREMDLVLGNIINDHRSESNVVDRGQADKDLVDVLLKLQQDGGLEFPISDDNIKAVILDIFSAGGETSATTIKWALSEMIKKPSVLRKAQEEVRRVFNGKENIDERGIVVAELKYLRAVIKETLRLHPPLPLLIARESRDKCEVKGYEIPVKTRVIINAWAIGRDARHWSEAETFWPERFLDGSVDYRGTHFQYIPFGGGRRMCPGISFAEPNIELPLAKLLYHFDWELPDGMEPKDVDMMEAFGLIVRRKNHLFLVPTRYLH